MKSDGGLHVPGLCSEEVKSVEDVNQVGFNSERRMVSKKCRIIILAGISYMWDYSLQYQDYVWVKSMNIQIKEEMG